LRREKIWATFISFVTQLDFTDLSYNSFGKNVFQSLLGDVHFRVYPTDTGSSSD